MPKVIYVGEAGDERAVDATVGESVMATAVKNGVPGIIGECGGNASCATCHVWVRDEFLPLVGTPNDTEEDLLDMGVADRREGSRLSCQIAMTDGARRADRRGPGRPVLTRTPSRPGKRLTPDPKGMTVSPPRLDATGSAECSAGQGRRRSCCAQRSTNC